MLCSTTGSSNSAAAEAKTRLLQKLQISQVNRNCCGLRTTPQMSSSLTRGMGHLGISESNKWRAIAKGREVEAQGIHWQSTEMQHYNATGSGSHKLPHVFPLFDFYTAEITLELLHSLTQLLRRHLFLAHISCYYCPVVLPGQSTAVSDVPKEDLQCWPLCRQPLPSQQNCQLQGKPYCRTHRENLTAGPTRSCNSNDSSTLMLRLHQFLSQFL